MSREQEREELMRAMAVAYASGGSRGLIERLAEVALRWRDEHPGLEPRKRCVEGFIVMTDEDRAVIEAAEKLRDSAEGDSYRASTTVISALFYAVRARREALKPQPRYVAYSGNGFKVRDTTEQKNLSANEVCDLLNRKP